MLLFWIMIYIKIHATFMIRAGFCGSAMVFEALVSRGSTSSVHTSQTEFLQHNLTTSETQGTCVHDPIFMITNLCHNHMKTFHFTLVLSWQGENFRTRASQSHCRQQRADSKLFFWRVLVLSFSWGGGWLLSRRWCSCTAGGIMTDWLLKAHRSDFYCLCISGLMDVLI